MKKRIITLVMVMALACSLCACGESQTESTSGTATSEKRLKGAAIKKTDFEFEIGKKLQQEKKLVSYDNSSVDASEYNSIADLSMALDTGKIDFIGTDESIAKYLQRKHADYQYKVDEALGTQKYVMVLSKESQELRDEINTVLQQLKDNGKLSELEEEWITSGKETKSMTEVPTSAGKETIKVGVTGDYPPMDYVNESGEPEGYNVALLSEIAQELNVNIEMVTIASDAKTMALKSGKIDVIFEAVVFEDYIPDNYLITNSYFSANSAKVSKNVPLDDVFKALGR